MNIIIEEMTKKGKKLKTPSASSNSIKFANKIYT